MGSGMVAVAAVIVESSRVNSSRCRDGESGRLSEAAVGWRRRSVWGDEMSESQGR